MITKALENGVRIYTNIILKNAVATVAVLSLITILLLQSALTFEQNMTRDIEVTFLLSKKLPKRYICGFNLSSLLISVANYKLIKS